MTTADRLFVWAMTTMTLTSLTIIAVLKQKEIRQNDEILQQNERIVEVLRAANEQIKRIDNPTTKKP